MKTIWGEKIVPQLHHFLLQKKVPQQQVLNPKKVIMQLRWRTMKGIDRQQPHLARQYNAIPWYPSTIITQLLHPMQEIVDAIT